MRKRTTGILSRNFIIACSLAVSLFSCGKPDTSLRFIEIGNAEWRQQDTLFFDIDSAHIDKSKRYTMSVEITNNNRYAYRNLWLCINGEGVLFGDSLGNRISTELILADQFGKWVGSGFTPLYQSSFVVAQDASFEQGKSLRVKINQSMQDEPLRGIEKVGLKIREN